MNLRPFFLVAFAAPVIGGLLGCSSGSSSDGVKAEDKQQLMDANSLAKKVDGDYDKLAPNEKQVILQMANGDEASAKKLCMMMAHPPNGANANRAGGGAPTGKGR